MMSAITIKLLLVLVAVAFLGFLIGLSGMRLHQARSQNKTVRAKQNEIKKLTSEREALLAENANIKHALVSEQKLAGFTREKQSQLAAQQETLQVHSGLQEQRIKKMTTELNISEEKCIRLQRDFASFKANKLREVRMLKVSSDEWLDNEELPILNKKVDQAPTQNSPDNSERRPARGSSTISGLKAAAGAKAADFGVNANNAVKSKCAGQPSGTRQSNESIESEEVLSDGYQPSLDQTQPIIASELDIPSLAESELPDSVEELEFELAEQKETD